MSFSAKRDQMSQNSLEPYFYHYIMVSMSISSRKDKIPRPNFVYLIISGKIVILGVLSDFAEKDFFTG